MGLDNPLHIAFLLMLLLLVFGAKRLPEMGRSLGEGLRGFKSSLSGEHIAPAIAAPVATPAAAQMATPAAAQMATPAAAQMATPAAVQDPIPTAEEQNPR
jgi:sec-independent protein translocase protein TatA